MDTQVLIWIAGAVVTIMGWFISRTVNRNERDVETLKSQVQQIKIDYLHKTEFKDFKAELHSMFKDLKDDIKALRDES